MKLWPFKPRDPDQEPDDEVWTIAVTPWTAIVAELQAIGLAGPALLRVLQMVEAECAKAERRIRAEMNLVAGKLVDTRHEPAPKARPITRVRNHATKPRATTKPKRDRAAYYRKYRAKSKLRLVASNPPKEAT